MLSRPASPAEHGFTAVDEQADPHAWVGVLDKLRQEPFYVAYKARTVQLLAPVKGGRYLDIGGGTGADARALATHAGPGTNAVVLDRSATMAVQAARRGSLAVVGAAEALPFETATFHGCRADRTFQHLAEPERALMELLRVTQPGGRIVVVDPDYDTQVVDVDDQQLARRVLLFRADQLLRNGTLAHRMAGLFAAAGLVDVKVEAMTLVVRDPNAVDNVMGLRTWAATAHQRGLLAADDAAAWPRAIDRAVAAGRFLYAVTFFLTAGTTPLVRAQPIGCRDPAAAPRHPRWTHSSVQAIVTSHAGSPTPEHPKSITAPKRPSLTSRFAALTSRGNQTDGPSHVAPMLFPRPQSPSRQRSDRPTQRWRSGFRRHGLQRPTAEAVVPPRRRSVGRIDLQPPVFLLHLRRVYASALGSRTNMSTPRRSFCCPTRRARPG